MRRKDKSEITPVPVCVKKAKPINHNNPNDVIIIKGSKALFDMQLYALVQRHAVVSEVVYGTDGEVRGYWCRLLVPYKGESEWYVPVQSVGKTVMRG